MRKIYILAVFALTIHLAVANDIIYTQRQQSYMDNALTNLSPDALTIQASKGIPVDAGLLNTILVNLTNRSTADFDIVKLIRVISW